MLFNSPSFLFFFLPIVWLVFAALKKYGKFQWSLGWLLAASLFFYGWWNPPYLALLVGSIGFNFLAARRLDSLRNRERSTRFTLFFSVGVNLFLLGYFKYADFFLQNVGKLFQVQDIPVLNAMLPLAISFFTFQQIAFLVDVARGKIAEDRFSVYALFISFFPQLIAGPIVHYKELVPQLMRHTTHRVASNRFLSLGITLFGIGLFKKVILADILAIPVDSLHRGIQNTPDLVSSIDAWIGAVAFSFQIYFDFSGYSDMAIGLGLMFGVILPMNFFSPYMASGIADFWRRWHITLSTFLRDYIYIPLGGNRKGRAIQFAAILVTMLLGGLWHGAGWTFVLWGGLHGVFIVASHLLGQKASDFQSELPMLMRGFLRASRIGFTFIIVTLLWVLFRAETPQIAYDIWCKLFDGNHGGTLNLVRDHKVMVVIIVSALVVWLLPNSMMFTHLAKRSAHHDLLYVPMIDIFRKFIFRTQTRFVWVSSVWNAVWVSCVFFMSLILMYSTLSQEFIYFDF